MKILAITPDYSLNGANIALLELSAIWKTLSYEISFLSHEDGSLSDRFKSISESCEVIPFVPTDSETKQRLTNSYDMVFLNSSSVHLYALIFQNTDVPVFWWFHEGPEQLSQNRTHFVHLAMLSENFTILSVTPKAKRGLEEIFNIDSFVMEEPVADAISIPAPNPGGEDKVTFFILAAYTYIKGQDILLKAIDRLPDNYKSKASFVFAGYHLPTQKDFYSTIKNLAEMMPCVTMMDEIPREKVYEYYMESTCIVAPSRIDSANSTIIEGLMFEKICLLSDGCGLSEYLSDCVDSFVFENENEDELLKRLMLIIADNDKLHELAKKGRKIYETHFHPDVIRDRWLHIIARRTPVR